MREISKAYTMTSVNFLLCTRTVIRKQSWKILEGGECGEIFEGRKNAGKSLRVHNVHHDLSSSQDRDPSTIAQNFFDFRPRFGRYHFYFGFCEFLNLVMILLSVVVTDALLLNKFWT